MPEKRNIVLITLDSVRADHCSFLGYHRKTTPHMDMMAKKGLYFENAVASGPGTPVSLFGVFTGEYAAVKWHPFDIKPNPWRESLKKKKTLAQILTSIGYNTGAFTPNPFTSRYFGFNKGFQYFQDFISTHDNTIYKTACKKIYHLIQKLFNKVNLSKRKGVISILEKSINLIFKNYILKEEFFRSWESFYNGIIDWVKKTNEPFFLWVFLIDTHYPYSAPRKYRKWSNFIDMWYYNYRLRAEKWNPNFSENEKQKLINAYDDSILYADAFIKSLWEDLKDFDPIFIIHADHGEAFGEHDNIYGHGPYLWEEFVHVPLIIFNADIKGEVIKPTSLIGLTPMIMKLIHEDLHLGSLHDNKDWVISKVFDGNRWRMAVRMERWKFITGQKSVDELYDLRKDSHEQENVIDKYPELVKEMRKIVEIYIKHETKKKIHRNQN